MNCTKMYVCVMLESEALKELHECSEREYSSHVILARKVICYK